MQMRSPAAPGRTAESDYLPAFNVIVHLDIELRKMSMPGFQAIFMPDDHQIPETARIVLRITNFAVERGVNRFADLQRNIHAVVVAAAARAVFRQHRADYRSFESGQILYQIQIHHRR